MATTSIEKIEASLPRGFLDAFSRFGGGPDDMSAFITWFRNSRWEDVVSDNSPELELGWTIESLIYQYEDFPMKMDLGVLRREFEQAVDAYLDAIGR